jgi:hypothetical protein
MTVTLAQAEILAKAGMRDIASRLVEGAVPGREAKAVLKTLGLGSRAPLTALAAVLTETLEILRGMGASGATEDITAIRRFFMGVLRWRPEEVMAARLGDLADAYLGFCAFHGVMPRGGVGARFLKDMMDKFPDTEAGHGAAQE